MEINSVCKRFSKKSSIAIETPLALWIELNKSCKLKQY